MAIIIRLSRNKTTPQKPRGQAQNCALVILFMLIKSLDFYSYERVSPITQNCAVGIFSYRSPGTNGG